MASQTNGFSILTLGRSLLTRIGSSCDGLLQGTILACILCLGATIDLLTSVPRWHTLRRVFSCCAPCLQYRQTLTNRGATLPQDPAVDESASIPQINRSFSSYQEDFKVSITSHNAISIEILDGGICLESSQEDDIRGDASLTRIQQAIQSAIVHSETPIEKLDLFASHFRASLTAPMMSSILQVLPPLEHLQLGGLCLSVQELCRTLAHPSLGKLSHLALYDLVFLDTPVEVPPDITTSPTLCLKEIVAVFIRLEDPDVRLDPLLGFLQSAPQLRQFELVMDHSHAYVHGYPRQEQPVPQPTAPRVLFTPNAFSNLLQATANHLQLLFLEYVPLTTEHYRAIAKHGKSVTQLRLRDDPEIAARMEDSQRLQSLALLLRHHPSLQTVTLDGLWSLQQKDDSAAIFVVMPFSGTISSIRLRSLPMRLGDLRTLLCHNKTLLNLSLHNVAFSASSSSTHDYYSVDEEAVFAVLAQILKQDNSTLRRITWKQAEFRRTEVFPRHRKPTTYKCFQQPKQQSAQQLLHWYLTLNQRGIRYLMADLHCSRTKFLNLLTEQQRSPQIQILAGDSGHMQHIETVAPGKGNQDNGTQGYALDCVFHMLSTNPSLCR